MAGTLNEWHGKTDCTHGREAKRVLKVGKSGRVWAGSRLDLLDRGGWGLVVSAVGYVDFMKNPIAGNEAAKAGLPKALFAWSPPPCIGIDWVDRGVPNLTPEWWEVLAEAIKGVKGDVGLCCQGGHGRTGTMLAILATLLGKVKKSKCPVAWVRKNYCEEAVESYAQVEYVEWVTGRVVTADPADYKPVTTKVWGAGGADVDPTGKSVVTLPLTGGQAGTRTGSVAGGVDLIDDGFEPTDLELLQALDRGDGKVTAQIENAEGRRWTPVYDENEEIIGWCEE